MDFFSSFIITQKSLLYLSGIWILLGGLIVNFALSGLFRKNSLSISNAVTIAVLVLSCLCSIILIPGFMNTNSISAFSYFDSKFAINLRGLLYCTIINFAILGSFLISLKHLRHLRHKAQYFNTLYLTAALGSNLAVISIDFLTLILSLETVSLSTMFIMCAYKNKEVVFAALKYYLFSLFASAVMIFAFGLSNGFSEGNSVLLSISKIVFLCGFLLKGGFFFFLTQQKQPGVFYNFPSFVFLNTAVFCLYTLLLLNITFELLVIGSLSHWIMTVLFAVSLPLCALKLIRVDNLKDFIFQFNILNFSFFGTAALILTKQTNAAVVFALTAFLITLFAVLSAGAIFDINHKSELKFASFRGICHTNPSYCAFFSASLFAIAGLLPSGVLCSRFFSFTQIIQNGLWTTILIALAIFAYTVSLLPMLSFIQTMHLKPSRSYDIKNTALKKRTKLNYFILIICTIVSVSMFALSAKFISLIISSQ